MKKIIAALVMVFGVMTFAYQVSAASIVPLTIGIVSRDADTTGTMVVIERCNTGGAGACSAWTTIAISYTQFVTVTGHESHIILPVVNDRRYRYHVSKTGMTCFVMQNPCDVEDYIPAWATAVLVPFELKKTDTRQWLPMVGR